MVLNFGSMSGMFPSSNAVGEGMNSDFKTHISLYDVGVGSGMLIPVFNVNYWTVIQGTWSVTYNAGANPFGTLLLNGATHADGDEINIDIVVPKGTYTIYVIYYATTAGGIADLSVDDVAIGSIDHYDAGGANWNKQTTFPNIVVEEDGVSTFKCKVNGQNPASSNHYIYFQYIHLVRLAV